MPKMLRINRHSASASVNIQCGVLVIELSGPVTSDALSQFLVEIDRRDAWVLAAVVLDFSRSAVMLDGVGLDRSLPTSSRTASLPTAMVAPVDLVLTFAHHALRCAGQNAIRQVFCECAPAHRWAQRHAARRLQTTSLSEPRAAPIELQQLQAAALADPSVAWRPTPR